MTSEMPEEQATRETPHGQLQNENDQRADDLVYT